MTWAQWIKPLESKMNPSEHPAHDQRAAAGARPRDACRRAPRGCDNEAARSDEFERTSDERTPCISCRRLESGTGSCVTPCCSLRPIVLSSLAAGLTRFDELNHARWSSGAGGRPRRAVCAMRMRGTNWNRGCATGLVRTPCQELKRSRSNMPMVAAVRALS